jgi:hypothetical protein
MSLSLLTFNNDIMEVIVSKLDTGSHLIVALTCKEMYKILKTFNQHKKLNGTLRYLTSTLSLLKYGHKNGCHWSTKTIDKIFRSNERSECFKYAKDNGCHWIEFKYNATVVNGLVVNPQNWFNEFCPWPNTCKDAARHGYIECLKYLHENGCPWSSQTCRGAAYRGELACLKYAQENGCPWHELTCDVAARFGHLECLKYAHENGCHWSGDTTQFAAHHGHLECLKYLHENGCPWTTYICQYAAFGGYLECLKYAHENGCPWSEDTCRNAAEKGHLECLKYAKENGCPWSERMNGYVYMLLKTDI